MNKESEKINVKYDGRLVGYLVEIEERRSAFQYENEWLKTGFFHFSLFLVFAK